MAADSRPNSAVDEIVSPYAERLASMLVGYVTDVQSVKRGIARLDPRVVAGIHHIFPGLGGLLVGKLIPDNLFHNEQATKIGKNFLMHAIRKVADAFESGEDIDSEDFADNLEDDMRRFMVKVDPLGQCHDPDCSRLAMAKFNRNQVKDIPILAAVDQALPMAACCASAIEKKVQAPAQAAKPKRRPRSALDAVGMVDGTVRQELNGWLGGLTAAQRQHAVAGLNELDSAEELEGFMSLDESLRLEMLPLLENRGLATSTKQALRFLGQSARAGYTGVSQALNNAWQYGKTKAGEFDNGLQPAVVWSANKLQQLRQPPTPPPRRTGFVGALWKVGGAFKAAGRWISETVFP